MNRLKHILTLTLLALLATACSKDDDLTQSGNIPTGDAGQQTVTFTVGADYTLEGDARTRSEGTDAEKPTRCFLQVLDDNDNPVGSIQSANSTNGTFQLSVNGLTTGTTYQFLFWADNDASNTAISDLKTVPYTPNTVAYAEKVTGTSESVSRSITLPHVVTKVTLQHSGDNNFQPKAGDALIVTLNSATTYNVLNEEATGTATQTVTQNYSSATSIAGGTGICHFYALAPSNSETVALKFRDFNFDINNVPLRANTHVTLQGDLSSNNGRWTVPEANRKEAFESCFFDEDGNPNGTPDVGTYILYSDYQTVNNFCETVLNRSLSNALFQIWGYMITLLVQDTSSDNGYLTIQIQDSTHDANFTIFFGTNTVGDHAKTFELPSSVNKDW